MYVEGLNYNKTAIARVQRPAPNFVAPAVVDGVIKDIELADYLGKYVVLFWYPMDFTFVCPTEIIAFNDAIDEFKSLDCEIIAASCDSGKSIKLIRITAEERNH